MPPAPTRYRDLQRPALVDPSVIDTGESAAARALGNAFRAFESTAGAAYNTFRTEEGRRAGAEAGRTEAPNFRQSMAALTAYGRAYNDAALRSYAIKSEIAADEAGARIESESGTDPEKFRRAFAARRDETIRNAPAEARAVLGDVYDRRMAAGMQRLIVAQQAEIKEQDRVDLSEGIARATERVARLRASNDPVAYAQAEEEELKLEMLIAGAQGDGTISTVEAGAFRADTDRSIIAQTAIARFQNELDNPAGDPIGFINRLREANKTSEALSPEQEDALLKGLLGELQMRSSLEGAARVRENSERQARFDLGNKTATGLLLSGDLSQNKLYQMVEDEELDPDRATSLLNELQAGPATKSVPRVLFDYEVNLLSREEDEISTDSNLSYEDRSRLILQRREWASGWRGTQEGREGADRMDRALGIIPGIDSRTLGGDTKRKRELALTDWYNRVDALPPAERQLQAIPLADEVIVRVIKNEAADKLQKKRQRLSDIEREYAADPARNETEAKERERTLAEVRASIQKLEQQAK